MSRWRDTLLAHFLAVDAADHFALELEPERLTYAELRDRSLARLGLLRAAGARPGDRIASWLPTCAAHLEVLLACHLGGLVFVPINPRYTMTEAGHILEDASPLVVFVAPSQSALLDDAGSDLARALVVDDGATVQTATVAPDEAIAEVDDEAIALIIYTSGTTGRSKGVELSFRAVGFAIEALTTLWEFERSDVIVAGLPLFHVHGLCIGVHGAWIHGATARVLRRFDAQAVLTRHLEGATVLLGVPTMYAMLVEHLDVSPDDAALARGLRLAAAGSASLSRDLFERFERHTGHRILERYGMSETLLTLSNPYRGERRPGSVGQPVPGIEALLVDDDGKPCADGEMGELLVRGPCLMSRYRNLPAETEAAFRDGWFLTGDVATRSLDGYFTIVGRKSSDIIKSGGFKIGAREIEELLADAPGVRELAVFGLPDPRWGEVIAAVVVPEPGAGPGAGPEAGPEADPEAGPEADDESAWVRRLRAHAAGRLADYKCVRRVAVVAELPRNAMGKVQKKLLPALFAN